MWNEQQLTPWLEALKAGQVVAAPAEGVYGYCCDAFSPQALTQLMELKQRDPNKGVICLISSLSQLQSLVASDLDDHQKLQIEGAQAQYWPCSADEPVTLILPAQPELPELLTGGRGTVAVRWPACPYMQQYLQAWAKLGGGPLVSTSLNISGLPPVRNGTMVPAGIPALLHPQKLPGTVSRIYDPLTDNWLR